MQLLNGEAAVTAPPPPSGSRTARTSASRSLRTSSNACSSRSSRSRAASCSRTTRHGGSCPIDRPATARSSTAAARTPGRTTGCSSRCTTGAARRIGYIWVDDPTDRLRPDADRLQILRAFANQATTALEQSAQFEEIQNAARASPGADRRFTGGDRRLRASTAACARGTRRRRDLRLHRRRGDRPDQPDRAGGRAHRAFLDLLARIASGETMRDLDLRRLHRDGSTDRRRHVRSADPRRPRRRGRDHRAP